MSKASASALWLRLTPEEKERVRDTARAVGLSMEKYARWALLTMVEKDAITLAGVIQEQRMRIDADKQTSKD